MSTLPLANVKGFEVGKAEEAMIAQARIHRSTICTPTSTFGLFCGYAALPTEWRCCSD